MNERIKELMVEAIKERQKDGLLNDEDKLEALLEKFSELIVWECASRLEEDYIPEEDIIEGYNEDWDNTLRYAVTTIREHFGVNG